MSYDLNFWRYEDESEDRGARDHRAVYLALCEGEPPVGLQPLPEKAISDRIAEMMQPGWSRDGYAWVRPGSVIEQYVRLYHVRFDLRGKWSGDDVNPLIDVLGEFGCPLYDPQVGGFGERFALPVRSLPKGLAK